MRGKDAHRLAEHASGIGVEAQFEPYPVTTHEFHLFWSLLPEAANPLAQAGAFVHRVREQTDIVERSQPDGGGHRSVRAVAVGPLRAGWTPPQPSPVKVGSTPQAAWPEAGSGGRMCTPPR